MPSRPRLRVIGITMRSSAGILDQELHPHRRIGIGGEELAVSHFVAGPGQDVIGGLQPVTIGTAAIGLGHGIGLVNRSAGNWSR